MKAARRRLLWLAIVAAFALAAGLLTAPTVVRRYWSARSSNPVRRGVARAAELGCFNCHGFEGRHGIPDPGSEGAEVPAWSGGVWMMYVESDQEIHEFILDGISSRRAASFSALQEREEAAVEMPAYRDFLGGTDLEDLTAAFVALSGMRHPPASTAEGRGYRLAQSLGCLSCHGPAGSGGRDNPGSYAGFIPGWYGADFDEMVRDRGEFDAWIRDGAIERLASHPVASRFMKRQRIQMPPYPGLAPAQRDDLWAYAQWLSRTGGGVREAPRP